MEEFTQYYVLARELSTFQKKWNNLDLSDEQRKIINHWINAIHAQDEAYTAVVFRMSLVTFAEHKQDAKNRML